MVDVHADGSVMVDVTLEEGTRDEPGDYQQADLQTGQFEVIARHQPTD